MNTYDFLRQLLVTEFGAKSGDITPESTLASLGLDSLSAVELIRELEEEYHIVISSEQATFDTLAEAVNIVESLIQARQG
ncbi:MAG: acyl carrier protein [Longimicrobiales bacterium]